MRVTHDVSQHVGSHKYTHFRFSFHQPTNKLNPQVLSTHLICMWAYVQPVFVWSGLNFIWGTISKPSCFQHSEYDMLTRYSDLHYSCQQAVTEKAQPFAKFRFINDSCHICHQLRGRREETKVNERHKPNGRKRSKVDNRMNKWRYGQRPWFKWLLGLRELMFLGMSKQSD